VDLLEANLGPGGTKYTEEDIEAEWALKFAASAINAIVKPFRL
jgi:hypothetical protein